jgi:hypothetical protein
MEAYVPPNVGDFQRAREHYIPENSTFQNYIVYSGLWLESENIFSYIVYSGLWLESENIFSKCRNNELGFHCFPATLNISDVAANSSNTFCH